jgi:anti-sigma factor RsiW
MTRKANFFGRIDDYCLDLLDPKEREEFDKALANSEELREEVKLHKEIQEAILELDVNKLKTTLEEIYLETKTPKTKNAPFELLDELDEIKELTDDLTFEELINSFDTLPKVHVYQHQKSADENVHRFYEEQQNGLEVNGKAEEDLNGFDMTGLEGLEEAVMETDILNLRDTLQQVAKSVEPQYSAAQIDSYLNGEMENVELAEFEEELEQNNALLEEVNMHHDIENAIEEKDIMNLRDEMQNIMQSETSWNVSEKAIEDFIDGALEEDLLEEFRAELSENTDLMAEVALRKQINDAIKEDDVQALRAGLKNARKDSEKDEVKSIPIPLRPFSSRVWRNSVAIVIVLIGLAGVVNTGMQNTNKMYDKYYESPVWASERSTNNSYDLFGEARVAFQHNDLAATINLLQNSPQQNFVSQFYMASSFQKLNKMDLAIENYTKVIEHGNNLFVEEAQWYRTLCYLRQNEKVKAKEELLAVINRKGYYEQDAKAILRKLRYKLK